MRVDDRTRRQFTDAVHERIAKHLGRQKLRGVVNRRCENRHRSTVFAPVMRTYSCDAPGLEDQFGRTRRHLDFLTAAAHVIDERLHERLRWRTVQKARAACVFTRGEIGHDAQHRFGRDLIDRRKVQRERHRRKERA